MIHICRQGRCASKRIVVSDEKNLHSLPVVCAKCKQLHLLSASSIKKTRRIPLQIGTGLLLLLISILLYINFDELKKLANTNNNLKNIKETGVNFESFKGQYSAQNCDYSEVQSFNIYNYYSLKQELSMGISYKIGSGKSPIRKRVKVNLQDSTFNFDQYELKLAEITSKEKMLRCRSCSNTLGCSNFILTDTK